LFLVLSALSAILADGIAVVFDDLVYPALFHLVEQNYTVSSTPHTTFLHEVLNVTPGFAGQQDGVESVDQSLFFEHINHASIVALLKSND
jgi:hypothetical protein